MRSAVLRVLGFLGRRGLWTKVNQIHAPLYRLTRGRVGHKAGRITNLLLTTTGRKSGRPRTVALAYIRDADDWVVVASNGGSDRSPGWWRNLQENPRAKIQIGPEQFEVAAATAGAAERQRLWPKLKAANPFYSRYEQITRREIPVVILRPLSSAE